MRALIDSSSSVIREGVASTGARRRAVIEGVEEEVRRHWLLAKDRAAHHYPRPDLVGRLYDYLASNSPRPLVLHGPHGAGKTSLVSQIAAEVGALL
jgi:MoxR-like ATPase